MFKNHGPHSSFHSPRSFALIFGKQDVTPGPVLAVILVSVLCLNKISVMIHNSKLEIMCKTTVPLWENTENVHVGVWSEARTVVAW